MRARVLAKLTTWLSAWNAIPRSARFCRIANPQFWPEELCVSGFHENKFFRPWVRSRKSLGNGSTRIIEFAVPAMLAQFRKQFGGKHSFVARGDVRFHIADFAHSGNCGGNIRVAQNKSQGQFRKCH